LKSPAKSKSPKKLFKSPLKPKELSPRPKDHSPAPKDYSPVAKELSPVFKATEEDSVIFGTIPKKGTEQDQVAAAAVNATLNQEIEAINESLLKISLVLNVTSIT
jgi:hypothetical protein